MRGARANGTRTAHCIEQDHARFAKAFDGPPIDPKVLEEQQKKLQEELQKRSEELRKRLESNAGAGAPAGGAAAPKP